MGCDGEPPGLDSNRNEIELALSKLTETCWHRQMVIVADEPGVALGRRRRLRHAEHQVETDLSRLIEHCTRRERAAR